MVDQQLFLNHRDSLSFSCGQITITSSFTILTLEYSVLYAFWKEESLDSLVKIWHLFPKSDIFICWNLRSQNQLRQAHSAKHGSTFPNPTLEHHQYKKPTTLKFPIIVLVWIIRKTSSFPSYISTFTTQKRVLHPPLNPPNFPDSWFSWSRRWPKLGTIALGGIVTKFSDFCSLAIVSYYDCWNLYERSDNTY